MILQALYSHLPPQWLDSEAVECKEATEQHNLETGKKCDSGGGRKKKEFMPLVCVAYRG